MSTSTTTENPAASGDAAPEGSFGAKPSPAQVDTLSAVMASLAKSGKVSAQQPDTDTPAKPPAAETPAAHEPNEPEATSPDPAEPTDPAATTTEPTEPTDTDASTTEDPADSRKPGWQKRIDKLTAEKKTAEETYAKEKADLEARIAELEAGTTPADPDATGADAPTASTGESLLQLDSPQAVEAHRLQLEELRDVLDDYKTTGWEGTGPDGQPVEWTPEDVRSKLAAVRGELRALPGVERALRTRDEKFRPLLKERYEWWGQSADPRHTEAQRILRQFPELRRAPNYELIVANHVAMEAQLKEAAAKPAATPAKPTQKVQVPDSADEPPPVPSTSPAAAATHRTEGQRKVSQEHLTRVQGGDRSALASFVASMMKAG